MMEVKVAGRQFQRVEPRQASDIKRVLDRRTKVKVSALLSPESQQAILMVREETIPQRYLFRTVPRVGLFHVKGCLLYTSPSPRDRLVSRMPSSA